MMTRSKGPGSHIGAHIGALPVTTRPTPTCRGIWPHGDSIHRRPCWPRSPESRCLRRAVSCCRSLESLPIQIIRTHDVGTRSSGAADSPAHRSPGSVGPHAYAPHRKPSAGPRPSAPTVSGWAPRRAAGQGMARRGVTVGRAASASRRGSQRVVGRRRLRADSRYASPLRAGTRRGCSLRHPTRGDAPVCQARPQPQ